jgi:dipeptidyl aminopeptidase/acylaminoacyl peptidase
MKYFVGSFILSIYMLFSYAQNSVSPVNVPTRVMNKGWDLNQHVWSHMHLLSHDKPVLDFDAMDNWMRLSGDEDLSISADGKYVAYGIQRGIDELSKRLDSIIIQATDNSWRKAFGGGKPGFFSADSKLYVFDSLQGVCFLSVGSNSLEYIRDVISYKLPPRGKNEFFAYLLKNNELVLKDLVTQKSKHFSDVSIYDFDPSGQWITYRLKNDLGAFVICNVRSQHEMRFVGISAYKFDQTGMSLLLKSLKKVDNETITAIEIANLSDKQLESGNEIAKRIWFSSDTLIHVDYFDMDKDGKQVVFVVTNDNRVVKGPMEPNAIPPENSIWYWRKGMDSSIMKVNNLTPGIIGNVYIQGKASFTDNGNYILFTLQDKPNAQIVNQNLVLIKIWDYKGKSLQSPKSAQPDPKINNTIFNLITGRVVRVVNENEVIKRFYKGNYAIVAKSGKNIFGNRYWEQNYHRDSNWLVNMQDGSRRLLPTNSDSREVGWFSPDGKYLIYFDPDKQCNYFCYNLNTGKLVKISTGVPAWELGGQSDDYYLGYQPWHKPNQFVDGGLAGWLENDQGVLMYDDFDIWKLDPEGKKPAVNLTNGRLRGIKFGLMEAPRHLSNNKIIPSLIILKAFNTKNKKNGYYQLECDGTGRLNLLCMDASYMQQIEGLDLWDPGMQPLKASNVNKWIVRRQTATEPSNYYVTHDLKTFNALTNIQTQKQYNWFTKEFHQYKDINGRINQGLLYKPTNFDGRKKYPVVIVFYSRFTDNLNQFPYPSYNENAISFGQSPAWLVSHGYLVFTPDMHRAPFQLGPMAFSIVEGAIRYLRQFQFVDGNHIGGCAHSYSAKLGTYIFTHSRSLAAMAISEGVGFANPVSLALSMDNENPDIGIGNFEKEYGNLWRHKSSWLDQTAVLNADNAKCPLLLYCGGQCAKHRIDQTFQLFVALRRLEKKTWWLEYPQGNHSVGGYLARDYTIRITQFFDHFLKGAPPPVWMTKGLPDNVMGIESRYELDVKGHCGKKCVVCDGANVNKLANARATISPNNGN